MSFRIANIENPIDIPDPPKDELAENTELLGSVQSTPARLHSQSSVTSEQPSEDGETELNTKYSSMPSLSERRHKLLHGSDASSVQSLVQSCQQTQGKCDKGPSTSTKAAINQGKPIKKSFKNVLPLLRQAKKSGLLPNIPFKQVQEGGGKTRRSSDPPKSQAADPWIKKSIQPSCSQIEVSTYSNRRSQLESPNYKNLSRESLDWLVYLNRSSLPPNKYLPSVLKGQNGSHSSYQDIPRYATFPRGMSSPAEMSKSYSQQSVEDNDLSCMTGSVSAPLIRRMSYQHDPIPPTSPEQIAESERMLKEMEDYMRRESNANKTAKFPMQALSSPTDSSDKDDVPQQTLSRQASQSSILSDSSHSSYESNLGSNESLVSRIQSFPARVASWKAAMAKTSPSVSTSSFPSKKLVSSISLPSSPLPQEDNVSFSHYFDSDKNYCSSPPPYLETRISCSTPTDGSVSSTSPLTFYPPSPRISNASASLRSSPVFDSSSTSSTSEKAAETVTNYPRRSLTHLAPSYTWSGAYNRHLFAEPYRSPIKKHCVTNSPPPRRKMGSALVLPIFASPTIRRSPSPQPSNPQSHKEFDESVEDTFSSATETETLTISQTTVIAEENEPLSADSCDSPTENSEEHPVTSPISNPPNETLEEKVDLSANYQFPSKSNTPLPSEILQDHNVPIKDDANCFSCKTPDQHKLFSPGSSLPCLNNHSSDSLHLSVPACKSNSSSLSRLNEVDLKRFNSLQNCSARNFERRVKQHNLKLERNLSLASLLDGQHDIENQRNQRKKYERWNSLNALHNPTSLNVPDISVWQRQERDIFKKSSGSHGNLEDVSGKELKRDLCLTPSDSALSMQSENLGQVSKNQDHFSINRRSTSECSSLSLDTLDSTDMCRDSAIFCDIELEPSPILECPLPPKSSIKEYVQYLEEKNRVESSPKVKGMKKRAPSQMIRQRLYSLQENSKYKTSRAKKEPEEFKELSKVSVSVKENKLLLSSKKPTCVKDDSCKELYKICSRLPMDSDMGRGAHSLGSLDQLKCNSNYQLNSRGWVKKLVIKFQADQ